MRKTLSLVLAVLMMLVLLPAVKLNTAVAEEATVTYTKVTSQANLTDGSYLIVVDSRTFDNAYYAFNGTSSASYNKVDVTFNAGGQIEGNFAANEIEITAVDGGFTLKNSAGKYLSAGNGSNTVVFSDTAVVNAISMNQDAKVSINMTTDQARELKLNINNDQPFFRYYKVSTTGSNYYLPSLYKKDSATTPVTPTTFTVKLNPGLHCAGGAEEQTVTGVTNPYTLPGADYFMPDTGWEFDSWSDGTNNYDAGAEVTLTADTTFTAVWAEPIITPVTGSAIILFTNDIHCQVDYEAGKSWGFGKVAGLKKYYEEMGNDVILVDAGDHIQGGPIGSLTQGEAIIEIMNAVGYDLAIPGNHEFDYGMDQLLNVIIPSANYPYLSANFMDLNTRGTVLDPYTIIEAGTQKIAFVGLSTPESITKSTPKYFMNEDCTAYLYGFCQDGTGDGVVAAAQNAINEARQQGATKVVLVGHMGVDQQSSPWMSTEVIARLTGVDAFIDGHSHTVLNDVVLDAESKEVLRGQTGTKLANVGKLTIAPDGAMTMELLPVDGEVNPDPDPDAQAVINDINGEFAQLLGTVVAHTDHLLTTVDPETINEDWPTRWVRKMETNLGDLCADAYRSLFDADIAFVNGGGVRANIPAGDITFQQIINVHPFGNTAVLAEVTGQQILDALEMGARTLPDAENGGFLHVSGMTYEIHPEVEANVEIDAAKMWVGPKDPTAPYRVQNVKIYNKETGIYEELDLMKHYTLAGHNYMLKDMGDGFAMFGNNITILEDTGKLDNQVLIDYIQSMPDTDEDGVHEVVGYTNPKGEGRIRVYGEPTGDTIVLFTNDVHCGIRDGWGYAGVAELKETLEAEGNEVILVDAGDHIQGGPIGSLTNGAAIISIMNEVGYDLAIPGNHEFDYGMDQFLALANGLADYPYISANFAHYENGMPQLSVFDGYKIIEANGKKIAFVGLSTPESITKSTPTYFMNEERTEYIYGFCQDETGALLYNVANSIVHSARNAGADYVIVLGHLGIDEQSSPWTSPEVIANITGVDAFIDGHSHSVINGVVADKEDNNVLHGQTGTKLANLGKLTIKSNGTMTMEILPASEKVQDDLETDAFIKVIEAEFEALLNTVVAHTDHLLTTVDPETIDQDWPVRWVRKMETNLGDLCADAYRTMFDADIAFVNGGGVRANIPAGDITFQQIINVHPFGNTAVLAKVTGQQILDALEMGSRAYPGENGGFLHVSGLTYEIHINVEPNCIVGADKMWAGPKDPTAPYRVQNVKILNQETNEYEPLDLEKDYTLAGHNYMIMDMGDGFAMFGNNAEILIDSGIADNQVLINYFQSMPDTDGDGVHEVEGYVDPKGEGRITFVEGAVFYGDDLTSADVLVEDGDTVLYRYDVKLTDIPEETNTIVGLQTFIAYEDDVLEFVEATTEFEGSTGVNVADGVVSFAWASEGEGVVVENGSVVVSLFFKLKAPVADGTKVEFHFVPAANGSKTGYSYVDGDTVAEAADIATRTGSIKFTVPNKATIYGEDIVAFDVMSVKDGERLYRFDIRIKDLPLAGLKLNSTQVFVTFDKDLLEVRDIESVLEGFVYSVDPETGNLFFVWASDSEVLFNNEDVLFSVYFAGPSVMNGEVANVGFTVNALNNPSAISFLYFGEIIEIDADTIDGSLTFPVIALGDANCDGMITAADAALILRSLVGLNELSAQGALNADVDGDLEVTAEDAAIILRYIVKLIDQFPVEGDQD